MPEKFKKIRDLFEKYFGFSVTSFQQQQFESALLASSKHFKFATIDEYADYLQTIPMDAIEFEDLVDRITIGETYFYRCLPQCEYLVNEFFPKLIAEKRAKNDLSIRVWSAASSGGQELYTIIIMLRELLHDFDDWQIFCLGSDINKQQLTKARQGVYSHWSFRGMDKSLIEKYFVQNKQTYTLDPIIKKSATFSYINLTENSYPSFINLTTCFDLILCRNVFIYFNDKIVTSIMERLGQCLVPYGELILSPTDGVYTGIPRLNLHRNSQLTYYSRSGSIFDDKFFNNCENAPKAKTPQTKKQRPQIAEPTKKSKKPEIDRISIIREALGKSDWDTATRYAQECLALKLQEALCLQWLAFIYSNKGEQEKALDYCEQSIAIDSLDHHTFLLKGLILLALDRIVEADKAMRQAIFLKPDLSEAYYIQAMIRLRQDKKAKALTLFKLSLKYAKNMKEGSKVHIMGGLDFQVFVKMLEHEISIQME